MFDNSLPHIFQSPVKGENEIMLDTKALISGDEDASFPPLKSEDSGIGLSASSPELSEHLRVPRVSPDKDDVWKKGGSMQRTFLGIQELIVNFAHKHIFGAPLAVSANDEENSAEEPAGQQEEQGSPGSRLSSSLRKNSWEARPLGVPQFKQLLSDLFTVRGSPSKAKSAADSPQPAPSILSQKEEDEWTVEQGTVVLQGCREDCREALAAACHLLLECATFPVYLSEEETEQLCDSLFQLPGEGPATLIVGWGCGDHFRVKGSCLVGAHGSGPQVL